MNEKAQKLTKIIYLSLIKIHNQEGEHWCILVFNTVFEHQHEFKTEMSVKLFNMFNSLASTDDFDHRN